MLSSQGWTGWDYDRPGLGPGLNVHVQKSLLGVHVTPNFFFFYLTLSFPLHITMSSTTFCFIPSVGAWLFVTRLVAYESGAHFLNFCFLKRYNEL